MYIHERDNWTNFRWDASEVSLLQEKVFRMQGLLYGRLSSLGFDSKLRAMAENLTYDVVYSSEIEGIRLNMDQVRSSIARIGNPLLPYMMSLNLLFCFQCIICSIIYSLTPLVACSFLNILMIGEVLKP